MISHARVRRGTRASGRRSPGAPSLDERGIIVLGPLIVFLCLLVVMVVAGKLLYPPPRGVYLTPPRPELRYALSSAEVYARDSVVQRLRPGQGVWAVQLDNGTAVVFRDRSGRGVVGVTRVLLSPSAPRS